MRIIMSMKWEDVSLDQYEILRKSVDWEGNKPKGAVFHVAGALENVLRVTDIWESAEEFNHFVQDRLMPAVAKLGITTQPNVEIFPVYAIFAPVALGAH